MINAIVEAFNQRKTYLMIIVASLVILAYVMPIDMGIEAKPGKNNGNSYGHSNGHGYGLSCDHFTGKPGPVRCR